MRQKSKTTNVSVLISAFNEEKHISFAIDSVLSEGDLDIELVLVDDASTDSTLEIMKKYARKDSRVQVIQVTNNSLEEDLENNVIFRSMRFQTPSYSIASAQNIGLKFCQGKYIARLDADDVMINDRLKKQFFYMEENKQVDLLACGGERINENGKVFTMYTIFSTLHTQIAEDLVSMKSRMPHPGWMVRREVYDSMQGYSTKYAKFRLDLDFMLRIIESGFKMECLKDHLIQYRQWPGNVSKLQDMEFATMYTLCRHHLRVKGVKINTDVNESIEEKVNSKSEAFKLGNSLNAYQMLKSCYISFMGRRYLKAISFLLRSTFYDYSLLFNRRIAQRKQLRIIESVVSEILSKNAVIK